MIFLNKNSKKRKPMSSASRRTRRQALSVSQILLHLRKRKKRFNQRKQSKQVNPIIPPKSLMIILKDKPEKALYNRRLIDYKHCGLLQKYIGLGGKILSRRQTRLTAKQQRYIAKTIKSARIMGLLPFVSKEKGFFR
jgi:small subunit ribosomal protein S18